MIALRNWIERQATRVYSHLVARKFRSFAPSSIHPTVRIQNPQNITLGGVAIQRGVWLYAMTGDSARRVFEPDLRIGAGTQIGAFCHITCAVSVSIGRDVLLAQSVLVADSMHVYKDPEMPIAKQGITCRPTVIGDGCWLGNHAVVVSTAQSGATVWLARTAWSPTPRYRTAAWLSVPRGVSCGATALSPSSG